MASILVTYGVCAQGHWQARGDDDEASYERERLDKSFEKLDKQRQRIVKSWIEKNLVGTGDPRIHGKALTADRRGQWRYRVGDTNPG